VLALGLWPHTPAWAAAAKPSAVVAAAKPPAAAAPGSDGALPGEDSFAGCQRYPADKRFRWGARGEIGVPELVASLGEIGCRAIVVGPQAARAGKVSLEVPDLLTAREVYRLFFAALE